MVESLFIFPVHNEEEILLTQIRNFLFDISKLTNDSFKVLIIENGSTDSTYNLCRLLASKSKYVDLLSIPKASYGRAIKLGLSQGNA